MTRLREDGFYWVLLAGYPGWTIGEYDSKFDSRCWSLIGCEMSYEEEIIEEVGDRIVKELVKQ